MSAGCFVVKVFCRRRRSTVPGGTFFGEKKAVHKRQCVDTRVRKSNVTRNFTDEKQDSCESIRETTRFRGAGPGKLANDRGSVRKQVDSCSMLSFHAVGGGEKT